MHSFPLLKFAKNESNVPNYLPIYIRNFSFRATIKDTWTKSRGRVEVGEGDGFGWGRAEGGGENADNCN